MTDPLERLRRANPVSAGLPAPPIEAILRLLDAEPPGVRTRAPRYASGRAIAALGTALAVAVAALALILVGHSHVRHVSRPPTMKPAAPWTLAGLRAEFGVFRRPQTTADLLFGTAPGTTFGPLTRLATTLPGGERVFLTVHAIVLHPFSSPRYALDTWVVGPLGRRVYQYIAGTPLLALPWATQFAPAFITWVSLVPDPVKMVRWSFARVGGGRYVVDVSVKGNVAAARLDASIVRGAPTVVWYGAGRRVLSRASSIPATVPATGSADLAGDGVLGTRFGSDQRAALAALRERLGRPTEPYRRMGPLCNIDHFAAWGALGAYFWRGRFVGYQYGAFKGRMHPALTGPGGLSVGEKIADAKKQFGHAFVHSFAQGGSWSLRTADGELIGYASQPHGGTVVTIDAGSVGCPALTP